MYFSAFQEYIINKQVNYFGCKNPQAVIELSLQISLKARRIVNLKLKLVLEM